MSFDPDWIARRLIPVSAAQPADARSPPPDYDLDFDPALSFSPAAVLIGLLPRVSGLTVLLTRRSDTLRRHTGQIALPGGRCEPGETAADTARREAHEEIGLDPARVRLLGLGDPLHTRTGFLITPVIGVVEPGPALVANADEVAEIFETPFALLTDPASYKQRYADLPTGERRLVYAVEHGGRSIWGVTAAILRQLMLRLDGGADV
jgi:8-oxo-dGTP pyrophosphatase MutT (NUDIX family)